MGRESGGVWLVIGVQGAGKTSVADGLANRFSQGVHLRGGQFYRWAVRGWAQPSAAGGQEGEVRRLLDLRYRLSRLVADEYCSAGFTTVVPDNIFGPDVAGWLDAVRARPRHLVALRPRLDVVAVRDAARLRETGKVAYREDDFTIEDLDTALAETPRVGLWLDTSAQTPTETVDEILDRASRRA